MSTSLALRPQAAATETPMPAYSWVPDEAPLAMPRQSFSAPLHDRVHAPASTPAGMTGRRAALFTSALALAALAAVVPTILYARKGFEPLEMVGLGLFLVLITAISLWFCNAAAGFILLLNNRDQQDLDFAAHPAAPSTRTALLMPLYNEDVDAALARLGALDAQLARHGVSDAFHLFVLSDSTKAEAVLGETVSFSNFRQRASSPAFYRRREKNVEAKSGNLRDWVERFGGAYDFMLVLDADSTMAGDTVLRLVDAMERNPGIGLIQTAPTIVNASTLFARVSQFGVRMYGRVAAAGLAWWTGAEGGYWGHNAIVRVRAFAESCGLPVLPGRKPFGGHIMSHDSLEAALLRRAGWAVHVTAALDGSAEETPPTVIDFIRREHRWCQGNLQHLACLTAPGLTWVNRLQLALGCLAYLASPLWFLSLVVGVAIQLGHPVDWASFGYILNPELSPFMLGSLLSGVLLVGPKVMGAVLVLHRPRERRAFGGAGRVFKGLFAEIALSAVLAPILMIANTRAVVRILMGKDNGWGAQQRDADGLAWGVAVRGMAWQMAAGVGFAAALVVRPDLAVFFLPIVVPLLFAPAVAVWTACRQSDLELERTGVLFTPRETGRSNTPVVNVVRLSPQAA
jgi:membrane glycosyltransferase